MAVDDGVLSAGDQVRHRATGDVGVLLSSSNSSSTVMFPAGRRFVDPDDLELVEPEPAQKLAAGELGDSEAAYLRLLSSLLRHAYQFEPSSALSNARLEPKLHQAFVAHRVVAQKVAPRMILADEVGLGKTIEAGLIVKELRARKAIERVLIVTPASLTRQWQSELSSKFNEPFEIIDGAAAKHYGRGGKNPFARVDNVICSLPFATQQKRADEILEAGWDLVIFDEAHRVRRTRGSGSARTTQAYRLAEDLKDQVHGLLLLSATPVQLHAYELYSLIDLVEPGMFVSAEAFDAARRRIPRLNQVMRQLQGWEALNEAEQADVAAEYSSFMAGQPDSEGLAHAATRERAIDALVEAHPLAQAIVRNRKKELGLGVERRARVIPVALSPEEQEVYERVATYLRDSYTSAVGAKNNAVGFLMVIYHKMLTSSSHALRLSFRRRISKLEDLLEEVRQAKKSSRPSSVLWEDLEEESESLEIIEGQDVSRGSAAIRMEIEILRDLAAELDEIRDTKAAELVKLLTELHGSGDKAVVFTQFVETQHFLAGVLEHNGLKVATFNGRMSSDEKEAAIRRFREHADLLISTEAGGEGRNLQFASIIVNYDLPWNPMKVEQRIGRLDRIGQTRPVQIFNLVCEGTIEERIMEVLRDRIKLFEESVGALDPILGGVEKDIERIALLPGNVEQSFREYGDGLERKVAEARLLERTMADFVLDRASYRFDEASKLLGREALAQPEHLQRVIELGLDYLGGSVVSHAEGGSAINLSPRLANRLRQRNSTWRGVFKAEEAVRLDDLDFFAFGHPLVDQLLSELTTLPNGDVGARRSQSVEPGLWVEVIYRLTAELVVGEARLLRHLVSAEGVVHSSILDRLPVDDQPVRVDVPDWVGDAVERSSKEFQTEFQAFRKELGDRFAQVCEEKRRRLERVYDSQRERLEAEIAQGEQWLLEREFGASPRDQKIIPARRGRVQRQKERLVALEEERAAEREKLQAQELDVQGQVIAASLVVGES